MPASRLGCEKEKQIPFDALFVFLNMEQSTPLPVLFGGFLFDHLASRLCIYVSGTALSNFFSHFHIRKIKIPRQAPEHRRFEEEIFLMEKLTVSLTVDTTRLDWAAAKARAIHKGCSQ